MRDRQKSKRFSPSKFLNGKRTETFGEDELDRKDFQRAAAGDSAPIRQVSMTVPSP